MRYHFWYYWRPCKCGVLSYLTAFMWIEEVVLRKISGNQCYTDQFMIGTIPFCKQLLKYWFFVSLINVVGRYIVTLDQCPDNFDTLNIPQILQLGMQAIQY